MSDTDRPSPAAERPKKRPIITRRTIPVRRKAGQRANLTKELIATKAAELLETGKGLAVLRLARALGVVPATIKAHFPGGPGDIATMAARIHLSALARPIQLGDTPEAYLANLCVHLLEMVSHRPVLAQLIVIELSSDPFLDPELIGRLLECALSSGAERQRLPAVLKKMIGRICEMILLEGVFAHSLKPATLRATAEHELTSLKQAAPMLEADWAQRSPDARALANRYASELIAVVTQPEQERR